MSQPPQGPYDPYAQNPQPYGQQPYGPPGHGQQGSGYDQYGPGYAQQPQYGYQQPQQPQYGYQQPYAPMGQPPKKSALPWIIVGAVVVLVAVGVTLWLTLGGGSTANNPSSSPRQVTQSFLDAAKKQDKAAAEQYVCANLKSQIESSTSSYQDVAAAGISLTITGDGTISGDTAEVPVSMSAYGQNASIKIALVKEGGVWKVCDFKF